MEKLQEKIFEVLKKAQDAKDYDSNPKRHLDIVIYQNEIIENIHELYDPVNAVTDQIKNDPELFAAWRDNIANAFKDEVKPLYKHFIDGQPVTALDPALVHNLANQAAINFLNLLCDIKPEFQEDDTPHISIK